MTEDGRSWAYEGLSAEAREALASGLPSARLWSVLLGALEARATRRTAANLREQWEKDRFVQPCYVDQRSLHEVDGHLLAAAAAFEAVELSPLGVCSSIALASQNKIVSTARGTEVVSDPTCDWLRKLCSNNKLTFVASAMGSQLIAYLLRPR